MGSFKQAVLDTEVLQNLKKDLSNQIAVRGEEAVSSLINKGPLQRKLQEIAKGTPEQRGLAVRKALQNAALSGIGGAAVTGLAQGKEGIPTGLSMAIPGAMLGYTQGKNIQRQAEIEEALRNAFVDI